MTLHNPHDRFVRQWLGRPDAALDFLRHYLPPEIGALLDLSQVVQVAGTFVDQALQEHQTDLLYRVTLAGEGEAYIYVLIEHKSAPDRWVALQVLRYMVRIWQQAMQTEDTLPPILPVVLYHGAEAWPQERQLADLFEAPEAFQVYLPAFRYHLVDLSALADEEMRGEVLRAGLLVLKYIFHPDLERRLPQMLGLLQEAAEAQTLVELVETVLRYVSTREQVSEQGVYRAVTGVLKQGEEIMTSLAERWRQEGIEQGIEQGIERGIEQGEERALRQVTLELLEVRFGGVPDEVAALLEEVQEVGVLRQLHRRAITVASVSEFIDVVARLSAERDVPDEEE